MDWLISVLVVLLGLLARFGIPVAVTLVLVLWMRHMDEQWKLQAEQDRVFSSPRSQARNPGCWRINKCSPERRSSCKAFANPETPCWQVFRSLDGHLMETCVGCEVFKAAPVPA